MSLLNVMTEKKLVSRQLEDRAFRYTVRFRADQTQRKVLRDLLNRLFQGSASSLVARLLEQARPTARELDAIHDVIAQYKKQQEGRS
jgi:predicted transcriptional regulator